MRQLGWLGCWRWWGLGSWIVGSPACKRMFQCVSGGCRQPPNFEQLGFVGCLASCASPAPQGEAGLGVTHVLDYGNFSRQRPPRGSRAKETKTAGSSTSAKTKQRQPTATATTTAAPSGKAVRTLCGLRVLTESAANALCGGRHQGHRQHGGVRSVSANRAAGEQRVACAARADRLV